MKHVLVISSFVSASQVGGNVSAFCLAAHHITPILLPTTMLGRHPGWGEPGGGPVPRKIMGSMWNAISAQPLSFDAVLTGYMADPDQIGLAADIIDQIKSQNTEAIILVDPVMGDHGRLYVPKPVAERINDDLVPRADILTPNLFEFSEITGHIPDSTKAALEHCSNRGGEWLVSSLSEDGLSGAVFSNDTYQMRIKHPLLSTAPNGSGDALASLFLARRLNGESPDKAFQMAVSSVFAVLAEAQAQGANELPLIDFRAHLTDPPPLDLQTV